MTTQTTAARISALYSDDGSCNGRYLGCTCGVGDGTAYGNHLRGHAYDCAGVERSILDDCREAAGSRGAYDGSHTRFDFDDGSSIVVGPAAWDFGFSGSTCHCWTGTGRHDENHCSMIARD